MAISTGLLLFSNRNPLHNIPRHPPPPAIVKPGRSRIRVAGQILDVFHGDALVQQVGNAGDAKRVARQFWRQPRIAHPPLDHPVDIIGRQGRLGQPFLFSDGCPEEGSLFRGIA